VARYNAANTDLANQTATLRQRLRETTEAVRNDRKLTPEGKLTKIARSYLDTKKTINDLKAAELQARTSRTNDLRRQLFGNTATDPQHAISYRDAHERVSSLSARDENKALALLDRAELSGDQILVKALISRAVEAGWVNVANTYIEAHPYEGQKLEELWEMQPPTDDHVTGLKEIIIEAGAFAVDTPAELTRFNYDSQIEQIAEANV